MYRDVVEHNFNDVPHPLPSTGAARGFQRKVVPRAQAASASALSLSPWKCAHRLADHTNLFSTGRTTMSSLTPNLSLTPPFDGLKISGLRTERSALVVLPTLEEKSQYVFQIVSDPVTSDSVAKVMDEMGVRRSLDRVAASEAIGVIPRGNA